MSELGKYAVLPYAPALHDTWHEAEHVAKQMQGKVYVLKVTSIMETHHGSMTAIPNLTGNSNG